MNNFRFWNNLMGWLTFAIAAFTYILTMEPTASFWDCGEFISAAFKLEVGHPPGAPFFMILGRLFTLFAGSNNELVPVMVNGLSALASAFTILFLFWSITHLARKFTASEKMSVSQFIAVIGSGLVGALAYTFSDTFWFSAVEGEVYATSSFFTAIVFWAILKWEDCADEKYANRWIILIAYLMGLSIGVHLLNLLAIPAIVFVIYFKKYKVTPWGIVVSAAISVFLLAFVMYGVIHGLIKVATWFELLFVNGFGLPFNSGVLFYALVVLGSLFYFIWYTYTKAYVVWNTILLSLFVIIIGYSSYTMIVIRSAANPPMDQNDPEDLFSLLAYLNREQYGDRPLLFGQYFNAPIEEVNEKSKPVYTQVGKRYEITSYKPEYEYDKRFTTLFPRMYNNDNNHIKVYKEWANIKGRPISVTGNDGKPRMEYCPTFGENLVFFFRYQIGYMYMRYFMWNFAGRQNDVQGVSGEPLKGNWISGIPVIDEWRLGPQDKLPEGMANNKGRNAYYLLPLLLGFAGLFFQSTRNRNDFTVVTLLFVLTGLAIVVYLNQTPIQPRERDYAFAGSFYAFTIWIGLGVFAIYDLLRKKIPGTPVAIGVTVLCLLVPAKMAAENWDDHDRSGRYTARDFANNYLNSCEKDAIIFTNGDNDTFPLWYAQEVEGIRRDIRVVNLSYLGADWYVEQMTRRAYESAPLPISFKKEEYLAGKRDVIYLFDDYKQFVHLNEAMKFIKSELPETKRRGQYPGRLDYLPVKRYFLPVNKQAVIDNNILTPTWHSQIVDTMRWITNRGYMTKSDLMVLDMLNNNNWKRPMYFAITVSRENYNGLDEYFQVHGLAYKIVPVKTATTEGDLGSIDTEIMYNNMMNKFKWGGIDNPKVYLDENNMRMLSNFRNNFSRLASELIKQGKPDSARKVLDKCMDIMPHESVPYNFFMIPIAENYYKLNNPELADSIVRKLADLYESEIIYYNRLPNDLSRKLDYEKRVSMYVIQQLSSLTTDQGRKELSEELQAKMSQLMGSLPQNMQ